MAIANKKWYNGGTIVIEGVPFQLVGLQTTYENHAVAAHDPKDPFGYTVNQVSALSPRVFLKVGIDENHLYDMMKYSYADRRSGYDIFGWTAKKRVRIELEDGYGEMRVYHVEQSRERERMVTVFEIEGELNWSKYPNVMKEQDMGGFSNYYSYGTSNTYTVDTGSWNTSWEKATASMKDFSRAASKPAKKSDMDWLNERVSAVRSRAA